MNTKFRVIPSIDLLRGQVVRLTHGAFDSAIQYGDPISIASAWKAQPDTPLHVVDLEGSRTGKPIELANVRRLVELGFDVQVGGGIRSVSDASLWFEAGASKIVVGTVAADSPELFGELVHSFGAERIIGAIDLRDGVVRVKGWESASSSSLEAILARMESLGVGELLVTDISTDGTMQGPSFDLYRRLANLTSAKIIASGGVGSITDLTSLARIGNLSGAVIGKALHEGRINYQEAQEFVDTASTIPERVIPCLDVRNGRVVKGVRFESIRDAGDPVECAIRYELEGADELIVLDISATQEERATSLEIIHRISESLFIPLTVGGGVRSVEDFRQLLRAGADRVAINTAAIVDPSLLSAVANEFGVQAVVLACDARMEDGVFRVVARAGSQSVPLEAGEWCARAESLGAGEILLTSIDRDGTGEGFDIPMLREVTRRLKIGVIASGGAGKLEHFTEAIERGGARAVLAASLFHDRKLSIGEVKASLAEKGIPVRA